MDASARKSMLVYLEKRIEAISQEAEMHRKRGQHEEAAHWRAVQQMLAEMHSMLRATAPGEWAHIAEPSDVGRAFLEEVADAVDPENAAVDGDDVPR